MKLDLPLSIDLIFVERILIGLVSFIVDQQSGIPCFLYTLYSRRKLLSKLCSLRKVSASFAFLVTLIYNLVNNFCSVCLMLRYVSD